MAVIQESALHEHIISGEVPKLVESIISLALDSRASDIHLEPNETAVRLRYRVDGKLRNIVEYPANLHSAVVSRVKIMSNLRIDESRIPQDGRTQVTSKDGRAMDLRVSTLPTVHGEKIVMRLQDKSREIPTLKTLGISGQNLEKLEKAIREPNGIVLTTGPTGSGKTTTLYSCLNIINEPEVNIMTIEDPVEIEMLGLNQSQVKPDIGYSFASGLRTALRQDPDIIMVGEIRDKETVQIAIEASLTGHLVLSTLHTNSAATTITRILDMGVPAFLLSATLNVIIAQRLVRRICENCKKEVPVDDSTARKLKVGIDGMNSKAKAALPGGGAMPKVCHVGSGCESCGGTGYTGRVGLYEVMTISNGIKQAMIDGKSNLEIEKKAVEEGMITLEQDGIRNILEGVTTAEEVYAVARTEDDVFEDIPNETPTDNPPKQ